MARDQWGTRLGFILAAVGSAIGLGNIWRFPYVAASNGGGAFLLPYFFAIITAGIPIMILEFVLGNKFNSSAPMAFAKIKKKWEILGWFQAAVAFFISVYYVAVVAWSISYMVFGATQAWGTDTKGFFFGNYLGLTDSPWIMGGIQWSVFIPFMLVWIISYLILVKGVKNGIEKANKILMPALLILTAIIVVRGLTLPGAVDGLNYLFTPQWDKIFDAKVWVAAYGQIFFSLSIGFAIMITYSSYLPKKTDIVNSAFMTSFANCGFSLFAALGVFSVLGYMAHSQGVAVSEVATAGVGLAFVVFPQAINAIPALKGVVGTAFFATLVFAGMSSFISIIEAFMAAIMEKFSISRKKALNICMGTAFVLSLPFATNAGLYYLDIVDYFTNNVGIVVGGLIEVILIGWFFNLESVRQHANRYSDFTIGSWWNFMIKVVTPLLLSYMFVRNIIMNIQAPYEGYPWSAVIIIGWGVFAACIVLGIVFYTIKGKESPKLGSNKEVDCNE